MLAKSIAKIIDFLRGNKVRKIIVIIFGLAGAGCLFFYFSPFVVGGAPRLEYKILAPAEIMGSAYKVYGNPKLGFWANKLILSNNGKGAAYDIKISYKIEECIDWSEPKIYPVLLPGSTIVDLNYPIFSSEIAKLKTSMPSNIRVKITYAEKSEGAIKEISASKPINVLGGHDFIFSSIPPEESTGTFYDIFSNYPLVAAWVTPADPVVMGFSDLGTKLAGGAGASLSDEAAIKSLSGIWVVAVNNNIEYKTEPSAFWTGKLSQFVKYPRDVIKDRAGTCFDTAIWMAAVASAQGLKPYVIMMPGHAFPVIQLPSGQNIPIESTALNSKVSFEEAVDAGVKTYEKAMQGPYVVVDVQEFQGQGVIPPELEQLPADILEKWGISQRGSGSASSSSASQSSNSGDSSSNSGSGLKIFSNSYPAWQISYPDNWTAAQAASEVDFYSPSREVEFIVSWAYGLSASAVRMSIEQYLLAPMGAEALSQSQDSVAKVPAAKVVYKAMVNGSPYLFYARYFESQGNGFAIIYDFPDDSSAQNNQKTCETILKTFSF